MNLENQIVELKKICPSDLKWQNRNFVEVSSPSNIAFVKYWGKKDFQLPMNSSLSMTLKKSYTRISSQALEGDGDFELVFEEKRNSHFEEKLKPKWDIYKRIFPILNNYNFIFRSYNSFPHSAGVASSASFYSALSCAILGHLLENPFEDKKVVSFLSRLGSGSACRSLSPGFSGWNCQEPLWARDLDCDAFKSDPLCDWIILVNKNQKVLSSSDGHRSMNHHPWKESRLIQAENNFIRGKKAIELGDWNELQDLIIEEGRALHALVYESHGPIYLQSKTLELLKQLQIWRENGSQVAWTLDAGPNIHLIFPKSLTSNVTNWIAELESIYGTFEILKDEMGEGASIIYEK